VISIFVRNLLCIKSFHWTFSLAFSPRFFHDLRPGNPIPTTTPPPLFKECVRQCFCGEVSPGTNVRRYFPPSFPRVAPQQALNPAHCLSMERFFCFSLRQSPFGDPHAVTVYHVFSNRLFSHLGGVFTAGAVPPFGLTGSSRPVTVRPKILFPEKGSSLPSTPQADSVRPCQSGFPPCLSKS